MPAAREEIAALIDRRLDAIAQKDIAAAIDCLALDVIAFEMVGPPLALPPGVARDEAALSAWLDGFENLAVEQRDLVIEADGEIGFAHALHHLKGTRRGGAAVNLWMRSTLCFRKTGGGWKIVHAHTSVPMLMDGSFRAALDLEP